MWLPWTLLYLFKNTKLGLSATSQENLRMYLKKFEWNILLILIMHLHYTEFEFQTKTL